MSDDTEPLRITPPANVLELRSLLYVPGRLRCTKCRYKLTELVMSAATGEIGVSAKGVPPPEPCPNDGAPMRPVSWEEEAREAWLTAEEVFDRTFKAEELLKRVRSVLDPGAAKHWTIVVATPDLESIQAFEGFGEHAETAAAEILASHRLVGVFEAGGHQFLHDQGRAGDRCALMRV